MRTNLLIVVCAVALAALTSNVRAGNLYFDAAGGTKTWDNGAAEMNWSSTTGGPYGEYWVGANDAVFEGAAGTVNVSGTITSVNSITFSTPGYAINNGDIYLTGSGGPVFAGSGTSTIASNIHGSEGMTTTGDGTIVLSGANDFAGAININAGMLMFQTAAPVPSYGAINVNNGGTVGINVGVGGPDSWQVFGRIGALVTQGNLWNGSWLAIDTAGTDFTYNDGGDVLQRIRGFTGLKKIGAGTLTLSGTNTYDGGTKIYEGTLKATTTAALSRFDAPVASGGVSLYRGGTLAVNVGGAGEWTVDNIGGFINYGDQYAGGYLALDTTNGNFTLDGTGTNQVRGQVGLSKIGTGELTLSSTNTQAHRGGTKIYAGTLRAATAAALPGYDQRTTVTDAEVAGGATRGVAVYDGGTLAINVGGASGWTVDNIGGFITNGDQYAGSQLAIDTTDGNFTLDGTGSNQIRGDVGLTKLGANKLTIATDVGYRGATFVKQGNLAVNAYNGLSSGVTVASGATLSGYGTVLSVNGAGRVAPGDGGAPGILTTDGVDASGGLSLAIELTKTGSPDYDIQPDSKNDVLRVAGTNPLPGGALTSANKIDVCLGVASLAVGDEFRGGVYVDYAPDFYDAVKDATYNYYVLGNGSGTHNVDGVNYYTLAEYDPSLGIALATVAETADFGGGAKFGGVMQFTVTPVPEPGTIALLATGLFGLVAYAWRKRK